MNSPPGPKWMCSSVYDSGDENVGRGDDRYSLSAIVAVLVNRALILAENRVRFFGNVENFTGLHLSRNRDIFFTLSARGTVKELKWTQHVRKGFRPWLSKPALT